MIIAALSDAQDKELSRSIGSKINWVVLMAPVIYFQQNQHEAFNCRCLGIGMYYILPCLVNHRLPGKSL